MTRNDPPGNVIRVARSHTKEHPTTGRAGYPLDLTRRPGCVRSGSGRWSPRLVQRRAADFDEFQPERLGLGQHPVKRGLIGQHARQHGLAALRPGLEGWERGADRLAQPAADTDLVPLRPGPSFRAPHRGPARESAPRTRAGALMMSSMMALLSSRSMA